MSTGLARAHFFLIRSIHTAAKSLRVFSRLVYGHAARAGDEPYILDTPFQILVFYYPFSLLSDPQLARALYTLILELALFALAILSLRLTEWETPRHFYHFVYFPCRI